MAAELQLTLPQALLDEVVDRVAAIVLDSLATSTHEPAWSSPYCTPDEAAAYLCCKAQRVYEMRADGRRTPHCDGGRALLLKSEVEALVTCASLPGPALAGS